MTIFLFFICCINSLLTPVNKWTVGVGGGDLCWKGSFIMRDCLVKKVCDCPRFLRNLSTANSPKGKRNIYSQRLVVVHSVFTDIVEWLYVKQIPLSVSESFSSTIANLWGRICHKIGRVFIRQCTWLSSSSLEVQSAPWFSIKWTNASIAFCWCGLYQRCFKKFVPQDKAGLENCSKFHFSILRGQNVYPNSQYSSINFSVPA